MLRCTIKLRKAWNKINDYEIEMPLTCHLTSINNTSFFYKYSFVTGGPSAVSITVGGVSVSVGGDGGKKPKPEKPYKPIKPIIKPIKDIKEQIVDLLIHPCGGMSKLETIKELFIKAKTYFQTKQSVFFCFF